MTEAERVTRALSGAWYGQYGRACCPACGNSNKANPALSIKQGVDGTLLLWCFRGCEFSEIFRTLGWAGVLDGRATYRPAGVAEVSQRKTEQEADDIKRAWQAQRCWDESLPISETPAEKYLRHRAISCELPKSLRFHPDCWHSSGKRLPALVARVEGAERFAIHRTYLRPDGLGKADIKPQKAMLGRVSGGAVRLVEADGPLVVAEGIETALSLACGLLRRPATIWAALSTSGMKALRLPDGPGRLTVAADGEEAGQAAGYALAERAGALDWQVSILPAPDANSDWNDLLCTRRATG